MRLIDADALGEKLKQLHGYEDYEANIYCAESCYGLGNWVLENPEDYGVEAAEKALEEAPTIDAVPVVHGQWEFPIFDDADSAYDPRAKCSVCGSIECALARWKYCPACGARMDEDGGNDDL